MKVEKRQVSTRIRKNPSSTGFNPPPQIWGDPSRFSTDENLKRISSSGRDHEYIPVIRIGIYLNISPENQRV